MVTKSVFRSLNYHKRLLCLHTERIHDDVGKTGSHLEATWNSDFEPEWMFGKLQIRPELTKNDWVVKELTWHVGVMQKQCAVKVEPSSSFHRDFLRRSYRSNDFFGFPSRGECGEWLQRFEAADATTTICEGSFRLLFFIRTFWTKLLCLTILFVGGTLVWFFVFYARVGQRRASMSDSSCW